ncbi:glutaredoxin domain-containing protein [Symmachiella dynata]|uniref:glutaredoxin domain-containing protein n=1 Tax=Symmachiella dynata TaxID=2527995 RepID=UPI0018D46264|nr:glutaredoxin domain-containing protein [Symmachiella dynata]
MDEAAELRAALEEFATKRAGLRIYFRDLHNSKKTQEKAAKIAKYFGVAEMKLPAIYGLNNLLTDLSIKAQQQKRLERILTLTVYVRSGCPHCAAAKEFLGKYGSRYPALKIVHQDVVADSKAREELDALIRRHKPQAASLPVVHYCNELSVGFDHDTTTGRQILQKLDLWSKPCPAVKKNPPVDRNSREVSAARFPSTQSSMAASVLLAGLIFADVDPPAATPTDADAEPEELPLPAGGGDAPLPGSPSEALPIPSNGLPPIPEEDVPLPGLDDDLPLPGDDTQPPFPAADDGAPLDLSEPPLDDESVDLPLFGRVNASEIGMPAFTITIGLVDGFNPCAMWVLLFLLSLLVNLKSRSRMFAIAGVFVLISGLTYFAFMAAWLNVFMFLGYLRGVQIALGVLAIGVGSIHVKDFFAFKKGISLSIPDSAKPGIYERTRRIVTAETMWAAMAGAIVLAVLVNIVELLCTAGLPALYTNVLMMQDYPVAKNYAYIALYNLAYMFDDGVMVLIAVVTLGRHKLQEKEGRWLKLLSGALILALGVVMIVRPEWLV